MDIAGLIEAVNELPAAKVGLGLKSVMLGVVYSLKQADDFGFKTFEPDEDKLRAVGSALTSGADPPQDWSTGFHFNSALLRIAAASHRALRMLLKTDKGYFNDLALRAICEKGVCSTDICLLRNVHKDINNFKHDRDKLLKGREIRTIEQAISATEALIRLVEKAADHREGVKSA